MLPQLPTPEQPSLRRHPPFYEITLKKNVFRRHDMQSWILPSAEIPTRWHRMLIMIMIMILVSQYPTALHSPPLVQGDALHGCFEHLTINSLELLTCHWCTMVPHKFKWHDFDGHHPCESPSPSSIKKRYWKYQARNIKRRDIEDINKGLSIYYVIRDGGGSSQFITILQFWKENRRL